MSPHTVRSHFAFELHHPLCTLSPCYLPSFVAAGRQAEQHSAAIDSPRPVTFAHVEDTFCAGVLQVVAILEQTRSSYLATFLSLRKAIQQEAVVAEDNLKFLRCLEQPCQVLATATAKVSLQPLDDSSHAHALIL